MYVPTPLRFLPPAQSIHCFFLPSACVSLLPPPTSCCPCLYRPLRSNLYIDPPTPCLASPSPDVLVDPMPLHTCTVNAEKKKDENATDNAGAGCLHKPSPESDIAIAIAVAICRSESKPDCPSLFRRKPQQRQVCGPRLRTRHDLVSQHDLVPVRPIHKPHPNNPDPNVV